MADELTPAQATQLAYASGHAVIILLTALLDQPGIDRARLRQSIAQYLPAALRDAPALADLLRDFLLEIDKRAAH